MAKNNHGGFTPPKGNPSGKANEPKLDDEIKDTNITDANIRHHNRNVSKGEDTTKPNESLDM